MLLLYRVYLVKCECEFFDFEIVYIFSFNGGICVRKEIFKKQRKEFIKEKCNLLKENYLYFQ